MFDASVSWVRIALRFRLLDLLSKLERSFEHFLCVRESFGTVRASDFLWVTERGLSVSARTDT
jgi:hypothetical protein